MKKKIFIVYNLHDKFTEDVLGSVLIERDKSEDLYNAWRIYHNKYNSNANKEADVFEFEQQYGELIGFEVIEADFIQL